MRDVTADMITLLRFLFLFFFLVLFLTFLRYYLGNKINQEKTVLLQYRFQNIRVCMHVCEYMGYENQKKSNQS